LANATSAHPVAVPAFRTSLIPPAPAVPELASRVDASAPAIIVERTVTPAPLPLRRARRLGPTIVGVVLLASALFAAGYFAGTSHSTMVPAARVAAAHPERSVDSPRSEVVSTEAPRPRPTPAPRATPTPVQALRVQSKPKSHRYDPGGI
jgi:hypothetical protein